MLKINNLQKLNPSHVTAQIRHKPGIMPLVSHLESLGSGVTLYPCSSSGGIERFNSAQRIWRGCGNSGKQVFDFRESTLDGRI
jgi:hypothetical protein